MGDDCRDIWEKDFPRNLSEELREFKKRIQKTDYEVSDQDLSLLLRIENMVVRLKHSDISVSDEFRHLISSIRRDSDH